MTGIAPIIYEMAQKAQKATVPVNFMFGIVTDVGENLKIRINEKTELARDVLILTDNVRNMKYTVRRTQLTSAVSGGSWSTSSNGDPSHSHSVSAGPTHKHEVITADTITIYKELQKDEKVLLANIMGGYRYIILSRAEDRKEYNYSVPIDVTQKDFEPENPLVYP